MIKEAGVITIAGDYVSLAKNIERDIVKSWAHSRPNDPDPNLAKVLCVDAPILEFASTRFIIKAPILVREVMASARNHIMWAQTSRVVDLSNWNIYTKGTTPEIRSFIFNQYEKMLRDIHDGVPQDTYRQALPLSYITEFNVILTWRDIVRWQHYFRKLAYLSADPTVVYVFADMAARLHVFALNTLQAIKHPSFNDDMNFDDILKIRAQDILYAIQEDSAPAVVRVGDMIIVTKPMTYGLRSHLIRHRGVTVLDELMNLITNNTRLSSHTLGMKMRVSVSAPVQVWRGLASKRHCWIAQADLWSPLLNDVAEVMHEQFTEAALPCSDGICPFKADANLRIIGKDPGLPCPRHMKLHAPNCFVLTDGMESKMRASVEASGGSAEMKSYWHSTIGQLKGTVQ